MFTCSFAEATAWLETEPRGPAELRGHVVLVNFWTWTCINWLRQEPYVRAWSQAYRDHGLVVIGVHTPEFSFEHDVDGAISVTSAASGSRTAPTAWVSTSGRLPVSGRGHDAVRDRTLEVTFLAPGAEAYASTFG